MKPMFSIFQRAIEFDFLFFPIFEFISVQKNLGSAKIVFILHVGRQANGGAIAPHPPGYATALKLFKFRFKFNVI